MDDDLHEQKNDARDLDSALEARVDEIMEQRMSVPNAAPQTGYDCNEHDHAGPYLAAGVVIAIGTLAAAAYVAMQYWS